LSTTSICCRCFTSRPGTHRVLYDNSSATIPDKRPSLPWPAPLPAVALSRRDDCVLHLGNFWRGERLSTFSARIGGSCKAHASFPPGADLLHRGKGTDRRTSICSKTIQVQMLRETVCEKQVRTGPVMFRCLLLFPWLLAEPWPSVSTQALGG
jgi:hypothetical protein